MGYPLLPGQREGMPKDPVCMLPEQNNKKEPEIQMNFTRLPSDLDKIRSKTDEYTIKQVTCASF